MTDRELMQQALEWADKHGEIVFAGGGWDAVNAMNAWTKAARKRLAQPEQEPVACKHEWFRTGAMEPKEHWCIKCGTFNTTPPQTEQEPVAWADLNALSEQINSVNCGTVYRLPSKEENRQPLYTTPPQRKPLTDEVIWLEYQRFWPFHPAEEPTLAKDIVKFARAIEAAHGIKEKQNEQ